MKKVLMVLIAVLAMVMTAQAASLKWTAPTGQIDGYNIYFTDGVDSFTYPTGVETQVPDIVETLNLEPGKTYTFTATAWNIMGESELSDEVVYTTPAGYVPPVVNIPVKKGTPSVIINLICE